MEKIDISNYADEVIAVTVIVAGTACGVYLTYVNGSVPEFFAMGFGVILAHYFKKK